MYWPGNHFDHNGSDWICKICLQIANCKHGVSGTLRKNARYFHTISRCASGLRTKSTEVKAEAATRAKLTERRLYDEFMIGLYNYSSVWDQGEGSGSGAAPRVETRSRSRSPPKLALRSVETDEFAGKRLAKEFNGKVYFGNVMERIRGPVLAAEPNGNKVWQAVWKVVYDDADTEQLTRLEIITALKCYSLNEKADVNKTQIALPNLVPEIDDNEERETDSNLAVHGLVTSGTDFLDPRYRLLDLLTPTATQNRLSYFVELLIDKYEKQISNEALKHRIRKDSAAFGALDMPIDVRGLGRFLGSRSIHEVTRHRCGNPECCYAWIGAVAKCDYHSSDVCPDCGTPRYVVVRGVLKPQRVFFYFGAAQAIEALHRHPTFRANWKKNLDISMNAYRKSPDAARLQQATNGEALAADNGLYISMADGFQTHDSKTQSVTGKCLLIAPNAYALRT